MRLPALVTCLCGALVVGLSASPALGADASSTNYQLDGSVIGGFAGDGSSSSYALSATGGEAFVGAGSSSTYRFDAGYVARLDRSISIALDASTKTFPGGTPGVSQTLTSVVSVLTDGGGYTLSVDQDHALRHTDGVTTIPAVAGSIASPATWNEGSTVGFGFTLTAGTSLPGKWGTNPNYAYAAFPGATTSFHTKSGYQATWDATTVQYRLATSASQKAGSYSNLVTYTAVSAP